ncbi:MAG TPA: glutathione S-transferase N-terminal domain-containing protein [Candidatus Paceibacterota bacterium]|nr:glutathione S-transferase N-terminal domain-containing protein [Candidatus Paceibacterota bacterium]
MDSASSLTLYIQTACPYAAKVLLEGAIMGLTFNERNVRDPGVMRTLMELSGKRQTPYLVDEERDIAVSDSDAIIAYLHERFGETT